MREWVEGVGCMSNAQYPGININVTILCGCHVVVVVVCLFV